MGSRENKNASKDFGDTLVIIIMLIFSFSFLGVIIYMIDYGGLGSFFRGEKNGLLAMLYLCFGWLLCIPAGAIGNSISNSFSNKSNRKPSKYEIEREREMEANGLFEEEKKEVRTGNYEAHQFDENEINSDSYYREDDYKDED